MYFFSAVKRLIMINRIQRKDFFFYIRCVYIKAVQLIEFD